MSSKKEYILGFERAIIDAMHPNQGVSEVSDDDTDLALWSASLKNACIIQSRDLMEVNPNVRHPIPYLVLNQASPEDGMSFFVYQRGKGVGEERLLGNHSIGIGGHVNARSVQFNKAVDEVNVISSLLSGAVDELNQEVTVNGMTFVEYLEGGGIYNIMYCGFIRDDSNSVGQSHLGVLITIGLPHDVVVETAEPELLTVGFVPLSKLYAGDHEFDFENWSSMAIEHFKKIDSEVLAECDEIAAELLESEAAMAGSVFDGTEAEDAVLVLDTESPQE